MKKWINKKVYVVIALAVWITTPLILYKISLRERISPEDAQRHITIITPYNEKIRAEFGEAFQDWWKEKTGESVYVKWLSLEGATEIKMTLDSRYAAAKNNSEEGIDIDIFFGGGDYVFQKQAEKNWFVKLNVFKKHPEWFGEKAIPKRFSGKPYYDAKDHTWVGVCLSRFGICYNIDALKRRGLEPPEQWSDLSDPKYFGGIALADPTKSGSAARAFEMLVQQQMQETLDSGKRQPGRTQEQFQMRLRSEGWDKGLNLIQKIAANTRYFTDSSAKIAHEVSQGDAVAGICLDFYGKTYEEMLKKADGSSRLKWVFPKKGAFVSVDPVAIFRGAPDPKIAQGFVEFLLTKRGQLIWNTKQRSLKGATTPSLQRMPIRYDIYTAENMQNFTDPFNPYEEAERLVYQPELTEKGFSALRFIIRIMCLDVHDELKDAWKNMADSKMSERSYKIFSDTTVVSYQNAMGGISDQITRGNKIITAKMAVRLGSFFRKNYLQAARISQQEGRKP